MAEQTNLLSPFESLVMYDRYKFVFTAKEAESEGVTEPIKLPKLIRNAISLTRAPFSKYKVGAVGRASSGRVYLGVIVDFPGLPLHHSIHAEQFLVTNLALNSEKDLCELAVAVSIDGKEFNTPCGHCRQFLMEIRNAPDIKILLKSKHEEGSFSSLGSLFLDRFSPENVLMKGSPLLLENHDNCLVLSGSAGEICSDCSHLECKALAAANNSFSPYTHSPSGVALADNDGIWYRGWYIESVASNPSLGPVQAALVDFVARSKGKGFNKIVRAVLVEKNDPNVSQERTAKMILDTIAAPNCDFKVFHCHVNLVKRMKYLRDRFVID
ncbi:Cytidine and deoxycytidylate deaminase domain [Arabidopsis thaliana x Arabidopsis arenosa]|uniref:cytidine deaminase n=1 Tax=Arabidopsis thaliana x Arabidopsis arenosa TaxID=1240361 RepID=A0A8T2BHB8_9BRAS|nr:Cytidine and deoxycytidylate deaminase domain [Arabidopsis thaliana x Arabidopsis arenosa]